MMFQSMRVVCSLWQWGSEMRHYWDRKQICVSISNYMDIGSLDIFACLESYDWYCEIKSLQTDLS